STLGRIPGTWVLSAQGAHTASGDYVEVILLTALVVALALPLYYYRTALSNGFEGTKSARRMAAPARSRQKHLPPNLSFFGGCVQYPYLSLFLSLLVLG